MKTNYEKINLEREEDRWKAINWNLDREMERDWIWKRERLVFGDEAKTRKEV